MNAWMENMWIWMSNNNKLKNLIIIIIIITIIMHTCIYRSIHNTTQSFCVCEGISCKGPQWIFCPDQIQSGQNLIYIYDLHFLWCFCLCRPSCIRTWKTRKSRNSFRACARAFLTVIHLEHGLLYKLVFGIVALINLINGGERVKTYMTGVWKCTT